MIPVNKRKPGMDVWVVTRTPSGKPVDVLHYVYIADSSYIVVLSRPMAHTPEFDHIAQYHIHMSWMEDVTELAMAYEDDCYASEEEAYTAMNEERKRLSVPVIPRTTWEGLDDRF